MTNIYMYNDAIRNQISVTKNVTFSLGSVYDKNKFEFTNIFGFECVKTSNIFKCKKCDHIIHKHCALIFIFGEPICFHCYRQDRVSFLTNYLFLINEIMCNKDVSIEIMKILFKIEVFNTKFKASSRTVSKIHGEWLNLLFLFPRAPIINLDGSSLTYKLIMCNNRNNKIIIDIDTDDENHLIITTNKFEIYKLSNIYDIMKILDKLISKYLKTHTHHNTSKIDLCNCEKI